MYVTSTRRMAKTLVFLVLLSVLLSMATYAAEESLPCYEAVHSAGAELTISSSGVATCYTEIWLRSSSSYADLTMELQRYEGRSWNVVKYWSLSSFSDSTTLTKTYAVVSGYRYRVVVTANVYSSTGTYIETISETSTIISY